MRQGRVAGQHVGGVAAVAGEAGGAVDVLAGEGVAAPAMAAIAAGTAEPTDAHSRADGPALDSGAQGVDHPDHLVAGNARIADPRHVAFDDDGVAVADAAGLHPDQHLPGPRRGDVARLHTERTAGGGNDHGAHLGHAASMAAPWAAKQARPYTGRGFYA